MKHSLKRLADLEASKRLRPGRYVWARHDQTDEEAIAAAQVPAGVGVEVFRWRASQ